VRCLFLDTPVADAQVNVVRRLLEKLGRVPEPDELRALARREPAALAPRALQRMVRDLEPPADDEGLAEIQVVPFARVAAGGARGAVLIAVDAVAPGCDRDGGDLEAAARAIAHQVQRDDATAPCLLFAWRPAIADGARMRWRALAEAVASTTGRVVDVGLCAHAAGPARCWCRPPLPGLPLTFAHQHGLDLQASRLVGASAADRALARALGAALVAASVPPAILGR
jgi:hypothetical protein